MKLVGDQSASLILATLPIAPGRYEREVNEEENEIERREMQ